MPDLLTRFRELSPEALDLIKRELPLRLKSMSLEGRNTVLQRLQGIPEFAELFAPAPTEPEAPLWMKGLETIAKPFEWFQEHVATPISAIAQRPFYDPTYNPAILAGGPFGYLSQVPSAMPGGELREKYEAWQAPTVETGMTWPQLGPMGGGPIDISTKHIGELLPWFAIPGAGQATGWLGKGGKVARIAAKALEPAAKIERAVVYPLTKPLEMLGRKLIPKLPTELFSVPTNEALEKVITKDDWIRRVAQWFGRKPVFKGITEAIGGKAALVKGGEAVEDVTARSLLLGQRVRETVLNHRAVGLARLRAIHPDPIKLFGVDESTGIVKNIGIKRGFRGASKQIYDIAEHPSKYTFKDPRQLEYIKEIHRIEDAVLDMLRREGVDVRLLNFDEFSHWVHRIVLGRKVDGKLVELTRGFGRIGSKQSFEKARFYEFAADGLEQGIVYSPNLEQALDLYIQSAAKRVADQRIANMVAGFGVKPTERIPAAIKIPREEVISKRLALRQMSGIIERLDTKKPFAWQLWKGIKKWYPDQYNQLRGVAKVEGKVPQEVRKFIIDEQDILKQVSQEVRPPYKLALERAKVPRVAEEAIIMHPAFQGKIYPKQVADTIAEYWADRGFSGLQAVATMSSTMRTLVAAADFSAMFIQGLPGIFLHPKAWARGAVMSFRAFVKPGTYQNYLTRNLEHISERVYYGGYAGGFEYFQAMGTLQRAARAVAKRPGQEVVRQTYGRFEAAFGSFGDVARNEMWKGLKGRAKNVDELFEIARHLDRMTGVMSMKGLGIGRTQRDFETGFLWFAPRYTRAGFALVSDVLKGGLTGSEARKALGSLMAGGAAFYTGTCLALGQEPNFDPSTGRFMTIEIKDPLTGTTRHFGVGGMMTSLIRFGADLAATVKDNPEDLFIPVKDGQLNRFDNPFIRFLYSKSAPVTGFMSGLITGKNYFGEPFENPMDYGKFLLEQVTPIFAQELMEEDGIAPTTIAAEQLGLRTFPQSDWEKRNIVRDRIAQQVHGMTWEDLGTKMGKAYQLQLERDYPELQEAAEKASEMSSKMARGEGKVWDEWYKENRSIEDYYRQAITLAVNEFKVIRDGRTFRLKVDEAKANRRAMYGRMKLDDSYTEIYTYFDEPLEAETLAKLNPNDITRKEYYRAMFAPDMYDQFGNYSFDEAERREELFVEQFGEESLDYIETYQQARWQEPEAVKALNEARKILEPYWAIESQIWAQYPPELKQIAEQIRILERTDERQAKMMLFKYPQILQARKMIALYRKRLKLMNPDMASALAMFYGY